MEVLMLDNLLNTNRGYLLIGEAQKLGISKTYIQDYIKNNKLERVAHGLTAREVNKIHVSVPKTYNATHLRKKKSKYIM